jgi:hypothetical protein
VSVRCKNFEPALDLGAYEGFKLRVLGNGLRYKCIIRTDASWDGIGYCRCVAVLLPQLADCADAGLWGIRWLAG